MPRESRRSHTLKAPLTFWQRYGFLIFGTFASLLLFGALLLGWMSFHERRDKTILERSGGGRTVETPQLTTAHTPQEASKPDAANGMALSQIFTQPTRESAPSAGSNETSSIWQLITPVDSAQRLQEAQDVLAKFWSAHTWQEKLQHVRDAPRVSPLMQEFYQTSPQREPRAGTFRASASYRFGADEIEHLVYERLSDGNPLEIALVRDGSNTLKLDWESYAGAGEMSWDAFLKQRPDKPVLLRAYAGTDDYFNYEFNDPERFVCVKLLDSTFEHTLYAYTEKGGQVHEELKPKLGQRALVPITIRVAYSTNTQSTNCVRLVGVVADRWLLLDAAR